MINHCKPYLLAMIAGLIVIACVPQVTVPPVQTSAPAATQIQVEPITLRMAVADEEGRPSDPYVHEFINQVNTLSNGNINIEPT